MDVLKTKDRAVLSKPKLIVYIGLLEKKFLNLTPTQKIALKGQKRAKRPQLWPISNKDGALLPKPKFVVYINRPKVQACNMVCLLTVYYLSSIKSISRSFWMRLINFCPTFSNVLSMPLFENFLSHVKFCCTRPPSRNLSS